MLVAPTKYHREPKAPTNKPTNLLVLIALLWIALYANSF